MQGKMGMRRGAGLLVCGCRGASRSCRGKRETQRLKLELQAEQPWSCGDQRCRTKARHPEHEEGGRGCPSGREAHREGSGVGVRTRSQPQRRGEEVDVRCAPSRTDVDDDGDGDLGVLPGISGSGSSA